MADPIDLNRPTNPPNPRRQTEGALGSHHVQHGSGKTENKVLHAAHQVASLHIRHMQQLHHTFGPPSFFRGLFHAMDVVLARGPLPSKTINEFAKQAGMPPTEFLKQYVQHLIGQGNFQGALQMMQTLSQSYNTSIPHIHELVKIFESLAHIPLPLSDFTKECIESLFMFILSKDAPLLETLTPKLQAHFEDTLASYLFNANVNPDSNEVRQMLATLANFNPSAANQLALKTALFHLQQPDLQNMHQALSFLAHNYTPTSTQAFHNDMALLIRTILVNDKHPPLALMEALGFLKMIQDRAKEFHDAYEKQEGNSGLRWLLAHIIRAVDQWCKTDKRKINELQQIVAALIYFAHQGEPVAQNRLIKLVEWLEASTVSAEHKYAKELAKETAAFKKLQ